MARRLPAPADRACGARSASARSLVVHAPPAGAGPRSEKAACAGRQMGRTNRRQPPNKKQRSNAAANSPRARGAPNLRACRPRASRSARVCAPVRGARIIRWGGGSERESGAWGATDGTNETTPNPQRRAARERGRGLTESAWRADSQRRPTARVALGVRPRARSWYAPQPPARGLGARVRRAGADRRDERNDANPPTKSGGRTRPQTHRELVARGLPAPADRARCAQRASARPLVVHAPPASAGPRSERVARAERRIR